MDDGSTDDTRVVSEKLSSAKYIYQENQGLSAARNTGALHSTGEFLVFLDADDLLYPYAISYNLAYLLQHPNAAFVSGAYLAITHAKENLDDGGEEILDDHYINMLRKNYIGMHGTVMYRRWVFDEFLFDTSLKACEDYDLYLRVTRKYPVLHHTKKLAAYRMHTSNMSGNLPLMLSQALEVLKRQEPELRSDAEREAYEAGLKGFVDYYTTLIYGCLKAEQIKPTPEVLNFLHQYKPKSYYMYYLVEFFTKKLSLRTVTPNFVFRYLHRRGVYKNFLPAIGNIKFGDLISKTPFNRTFGQNRGGAIDQYYIENFLRSKADYITGQVLEFGENQYAKRIGGDKVTQCTVLRLEDLDEKSSTLPEFSPKVTAGDNTFDCILLPQALHLIYDFKAVVKDCFRALKPGGTLLLTVPGITPVDFGPWEKNWLWTFTRFSIEKMLAETFPINHIETNSFGNVYVASAFLYGVGKTELKQEELDYQDPHFQVIITGKATKTA